jgi:hypothetical protein
VSREPIPKVTLDECVKAPGKEGKAPPPPAIEEPKVPGPPPEAPAACVQWLASAIHGSHGAAAAVAELIKLAAASISVCD